MIQVVVAVVEQVQQEEMLLVELLVVMVRQELHLQLRDHLLQELVVEEVLGLVMEDLLMTLAALEQEAIENPLVIQDLIQQVL